ncbi:hypothetical protein Taro_000664 [Colocasia esculenta]|uniref:Uncharacterized protein n=1 Tax=Colocasia esculenta TaxID=4460 RepID=A0A843T7U7_COLES|nr:hypothetical protein [Colocasia esculenta]
MPKLFWCSSGADQLVILTASLYVVSVPFRGARCRTVVRPDYGLWLCLSTRLTPMGGETWTHGRAVRRRWAHLTTD